MIRFASRLALIAVFVVPCVAHAQAPWRQVYKDSDVTVIFDTATVILQSPGTWTTVTSWDYMRPRARACPVLSGEGEAGTEHRLRGE